MPEHDTPERLKEFAKGFGAKLGWLFLTGKAEDIEKIRWKLGERSRNLDEHSSYALLGNDATGEWEKSSLMSETDVMVYKVLSMDPKWRAQLRRADAQSQPFRGRCGRFDRLHGGAIQEPRI